MTQPTDIRAALERLLPCPFCQGEATLNDHRLLWVVRCSSCSACVLGDQAPEPEEELPESYWEPFRQSAVDNWNRRLAHRLALDVPPIEQEITGNGSGASLPPFSNQPRVGEPLPLWRVMHSAYWTEAGVDVDGDYPPPGPECCAAMIRAVADWLLPDSDALPIDELAAAQQHLRHALRARLTEQARVAREAAPD